MGLSHADILRSILKHACSKYSTIPLPESIRASKSISGMVKEEVSSRQKIFVLFGGDTSERQVSLISGTNVWLNLRACNDVSCYINLNISCPFFCSTSLRGSIFLHSTILPGQSQIEFWVKWFLFLTLLSLKMYV